MSVKLKRVYEKPEKTDGVRILVDRIWPRGTSKQNAKVHHWLKDLAPSTTLRKWFGHDPEKWIVFKMKYRKELNEKKAAKKELRAIIRKNRNVTLLFAAKDEQHNNALAIKKILRL